MKNLQSKNNDMPSFTADVAVIGLGYVGLPLAIALSEFNDVIGFDINKKRVKELINGIDQTGEFNSVELKCSQLNFTHDPNDISQAKIFIIAVPTPVDENKKPDLTALTAASQSVGQQIKRGAIVVYESTVWPGVTEDICMPILENTSGMKSGHDFFIGYSPERINPGDKEHTIDQITKVVSAQTSEACDIITSLYSQVTNGKIHISPNIRTAEAAKIIENAQRDINIAFINEIAQICQKLEISVYEVLEAAQTKWNFLNFKPGLVGGHCIGVDPYYLAHKASELGHEPHILLTGRKINDSMGLYIAEQVLKLLESESHVLILGLTFKEDVSDLRNSQVIDIIQHLKAAGHKISVCDPHASKDDAMNLYGIKLKNSIYGNKRYHCVLCCVGHKEYRDMDVKSVTNLLMENGLIADVKGIWRKLKTSKVYRRWTL